MKNKTFRLFANCIIVEGSKRAIICDLQRSKVFPIPLSLVKVLSVAKHNNFDELKDIFSSDVDSIEDYFSYMTVNELGFWSEYHDNFPPLSMEWDTPEMLNNAIIEINEESIEWLPNLFEQLNSFFCKFIEIRMAGNSLYLLNLVAELTKKRRIRGITLYIKYKNNLQDICNFLDENMRFIQVVIYSCPYKMSVDLNKYKDRLYLHDKNIDNKHCGNINTSFFSINIPTFTEAQKHNTCLNRKISIDTEGYIRNCPSMKEHYGNIKDTTLQEALEHPDFKKYWFINKDQVAVCKDCEFRYICTDCRAYIENPEDMYSKPLKCGYNPYTCEWEEWSINPLKQKAIDHYGMREMVKREG